MSITSNDLEIKIQRFLFKFFVILRCNLKTEFSAKLLEIDKYNLCMQLTDAVASHEHQIRLLYNLRQKILQVFPKKLKLQKRAKLLSTSKFDRDYLRHEFRYPKSESERHVIESDSFRVRRKKSNERWSTNKTVLQALSDPPKSTSSEDHISPPNGCYPLKFAHALDLPRLASVHPPGTDVSSTIFNNKHLQIGLKFSVYAPITLGLERVTSRNVSI